MPTKPHEYCVVGRLSPDLQAEANWLSMTIASHGYRERFENATYVYVNVDGWRYWTSRNLFGDGINLNRARLDAEPLPGLES